MGRGYNPLMRRPNWKSAGTVLLLLAAGAGSSCGGASDADRALQEQTDEQRPLAAEDRLVERKLVSALDIRREAPGSVRRAFLEYWSAIEYQEWGVAVAFMSEEIRRALEPEYLVAALRAEGESNLPVRPPIRRVVTTRGLATVRYFVRASDGRSARHRSHGLVATASGTWSTARRSMLHTALRFSRRCRMKLIPQRRPLPTKPYVRAHARWGLRQQPSHRHQPRSKP